MNDKDFIVQIYIDNNEFDGEPSIGIFMTKYFLTFYREIQYYEKQGFKVSFSSLDASPDNKWTICTLGLSPPFSLEYLRGATKKIFPKEN